MLFKQMFHVKQFRASVNNELNMGITPRPLVAIYQQFINITARLRKLPYMKHGCVKMEIFLKFFANKRLIRVLGILFFRV